MKKILIILLLVLTVGFSGCVKDKETTKQTNVNLILANATIPPVMATLDTIDSEDPTYMWYGRNTTFYDVEKLDAKIELVGEPYAETTIGIKSEVVNQFANLVTTRYANDKNAHFTLYVTDYGVKAALQIFAANNIPTNNYKVILLEDGTGSYSQYEKDGYTAENGKASLDAKIAEIDAIIADAANYDWGTGNINNYDLAFAYATKENVEYWLQYPEILTANSLDAQLKADKTPINFVKKNLTSMFNELSSEDKTYYQSMLLDKTTMDSMIYKNNDKKTLIVTGTSYTGEFLGFTLEGDEKDPFEAVMNDIIRDYGEEYNIVFKPHPAWNPVLGENMGIRWQTHISEEFMAANCKYDNWEDILERRVEYLASNNISVLPAQSPMEAIIWSYGSDIVIGGYNSSLYMNATPGLTKFFILGQNDYNQLSTPIPQIIEVGSFADPVTKLNPTIYYPGM